MLAKIKKGKSVITASVLVLAATLFLNINKSSFELFLFDSLESVNSYDLGYSSLKQFLGIDTVVSLGVTNTEIILGLSKNFLFTGLPKIPKMLGNKILGTNERPIIEDIKFDIKFEDFQTILEDRQQGIRDGILIDPRFVNAKITYLGDEYKAKIRLKGDLPDHWRSNLRMSLRVTMKGNKSILGMKRFSIHSPGSRQYPHDQVFQGSMQKFQALHVPHSLLRVSVNGTNWGVMDVEEHMSKEFLEKQESKDSLIFKFTDEQLWQYQKIVDNPYEHYWLSDPMLYSSIYQSDKYLSNRIFREQYSYIVNSYTDNKIHKLLSIQPLARAIVLSGIWNNQHALNFVNSKFYFNPYTLQLDTITTDQGPIFSIAQPYDFLNNLDGFYKEFLEQEISYKDFEYATNLINADKEVILDLYNSHRSYFPFDQPIDPLLIHSNLNKVTQFDMSTFLKLNNIKADISDIETAPPSIEQLKDMPSHIQVRHYDNGEVHLYNLLPVEINVRKLIYNSQSQEVSGLIPASSYKKLEKLILSSDYMGIQDKLIQVETEAMGIIKSSINGATIISKTVNPLRQSFTSSDYDFIQETDDGFFIPSGTWSIIEPIVLDGNLEIEAGTQLFFTENSYLIVKGSLNSIGTLDHMIEFLPQSESWKGIYVLGRKTSSNIMYTLFNSTNELRDGILQLTGGVTFYNSHVKIANTSFVNAKGEDALNIIKSTFDIKDIIIDGTFSDGVDLDFTSGLISNSEFKNIGGDAIDISGGKVKLEYINAYDVWDKAISAGEGSVVTLKNSEIYDIGVGIAAKDGSSVFADSTIIYNSQLFDLMTYTKKNFFKSSSLTYYHSQRVKPSTARQVGTFLAVNDEEILAKQIDIDQLYTNPVMSK